MRSTVLATLFCILSLTFAGVAAAQPKALRTLDIPADAGWGHAGTGLALTANLAGLQRTSLQDNGTRELDVIAQFANADRSVEATIYLFRPAVPNVPLWFDRARTMVERRSAFGGGHSAAVLSFVPPGRSAASALRATYPLNSGPYSSTALAVIPVGEWLTKIRLSSTSLEAAELDRKLTEIIDAIRWPDVAEPAPAATAIQPCEEPLRLKRAKALKPDMAQMLLGSIGLVAAGRPDDERENFCRDSAGTVGHGIYRPEGSRERYMIALADSGRVIWVGETLSLTGEESYSVTLHDLDRALLFPSFNRLPPPEQALGLVSQGKPLSSTARDGDAVNIKLRGE